MGKTASLFGLLGLVFLGFGFVGTALVGLADPYVLANLVGGIGLMVAYLAFGFEGFRSLLGQRSTRYGASAAVYTLLFVALLAGANYLGARRHHRWDVTEGGVYTLSPQSKKVVEALAEELKMTAFVEGGINPGLESQLDSYRYVGPSKVSFRLVDPDKEPGLVEQMKITTAPSVHLQYGKESFVVTQPTEEAITNGVIRVSGSKKKLVYFTEGFGEASIQDEQDPKGYAALKLALEQENYEVKPLVLPSAEKIPDDATAVVIGGPDRPLTDAAIAALEEYLKRGGRLFAMVGAREGDAKLSAFLANWGVKLGDNVVIDREVRLFEGPRLGVIPMTKTYGTHPITQNFRDYTVYPQTRSVESESGKKGVSGTTLVNTSTSSWAESNAEDVFTKGIASLDDGDKKGPVSIAVAATAKLADMGVTPPADAGGKAATEARLVVFGSSLFADNQQLTQSRLNGDLALNAVGWLVGQEELVSIRSRTVRASRAELTGNQTAQVFYLSVLIIPQLLITTGLAVWWRRRSA